MSRKEKIDFLVALGFSCKIDSELKEILFKTQGEFIVYIEKDLKNLELVNNMEYEKKSFAITQQDLENLTVYNAILNN